MEFPWNKPEPGEAETDKNVLINRAGYKGWVVEAAICRVLLAIMAYFEVREEKKLSKK